MTHSFVRAAPRGPGASVFARAALGAAAILGAQLAAAQAPAAVAPAATPTAPVAVPAPQAKAAAPDALGHAPAEYRLGAGDSIRINVYNNPDLSIDSWVTEAGVIRYPLLGPVHVGGLSITAAEQLIAHGLQAGNFVKSPQVSILLTQVRGNQASVLGQVNKPGRFPLEVAGLRVTDLLAAAGGVAETGGDNLVLTGVRDGKPYRQRIDLPTLFAPSGEAQDVVVQNGDVLWVDRYPQVYIYGEVQHPGALRLVRDMTLMQGLAAGGGLTLRGTERGIRVRRRMADGTVQEIQPAMTEPLRDGDVIYVRESLF